MPEPSPSQAGPNFRTPLEDNRDFLESASFADELTDYADTEALRGDTFHVLDPEDAEAGEQRIGRKLGIGFWFAAAWMVLIILAAVLAPWLPIDDPNAITGSPKEPLFSEGHILGTDALGRDLLSRTIWGGRVSMTVGFSAVIFGLVVGGLIGLVAGYFRGKLEGGLMASMDVLLAFPPLLLALSIVTFSGRKTIPIITLAIGIVAIPPLARLVRANTLVYGQREFVLASRTLGARNSRIMTREILPNVSRPALSFSIIGIAVAIVAEGALAFLGLSLPPPTATWGTMIDAGRQHIDDAVWISLVPATAMFLTVLALNFAGDTLREYFDVKEGGL
jgi:peptide/nickel transport system permease protein